MSEHTKVLVFPGMMSSGEKPAPPASADDGLARRVGWGLVAVLLVVVGAGGWAAMAQLAGAVIAPGLVVIDSNIKKVQHPTGGVIGELRAKNGDRVKAGEVVARLDDTQTRANLGAVVSQLVELTGRKVRLAAEFAGEQPDFPATFAGAEADWMRIRAGEQRLFEARAGQREAQKSQLRERIGQLRQEISGLETQYKAKSEELVLIAAEMSRISPLHKEKYIPETRILTMQRDKTRVSGEHGQLAAQIARARGQIAEIEMQILTIEQTFRSDAQKELRDTEARIAELAERRIAAEDQLKRVDIRAPIEGMVHEMAVHTIGGVVSPSETLMMVVPAGDLLSIEVRVAPNDIDQVRLGQRTRLRFTAFNQRTTPEVPGVVTRVAADLTREAQTNNMYFVVRITADAEGLRKLENARLVPGMPVEAFIETGERSALSYLVKPVTDQLMRAFRER